MKWGGWWTWGEQQDSRLYLRESNGTCVWCLQLYSEFTPFIVCSEKEEDFTPFVQPLQKHYQLFRVFFIFTSFSSSLMLVCFVFGYTTYIMLSSLFLFHVFYIKTSEHKACYRLLITDKACYFIWNFPRYPFFFYYKHKNHKIYNFIIM